MSKFGVFYGGSAKPAQVFEGRELSFEGEYVKIIGQDGACEGVIRLQPGQVVRKMTEADEAAARSTSRPSPRLQSDAPFVGGEHGWMAR